MTFFADIENAISAATEQAFKIDSQQAESGGCVSDALVLRGGSKQYFLKTNHASLLPMFEAEATGLRELESAEVIRVPNVIATGISDGKSYLVLEHLSLTGRMDDTMFGRQLAALHRTTNNKAGWQQNNFIGSTPQINTQESGWVTFFREHRLAYQLGLARGAGLSTRTIDVVNALMERLDDLFTDYQPVFSLLHGDLWSGNWAALNDNKPVIYDPAVYYGDHEADLAMMELFGSPSAAFRSAYTEVFPIDSGYAVRKGVYNLYHILNHFNLFGGGYGEQAVSMTERVLAELR